MAKKFQELRNKMSQDRLDKVMSRARELLAEIVEARGKKKQTDG